MPAVQNSGGGTARAVSMEAGRIGALLANTLQSFPVGMPIHGGRGQMFCPRTWAASRWLWSFMARILPSESLRMRGGGDGAGHREEGGAWGVLTEGGAGAMNEGLCRAGRRGPAAIGDEVLSDLDPFPGSCLICGLR